jgi:hypothetical protein
MDIIFAFSVSGGGRRCQAIQGQGGVLFSDFLDAILNSAVQYVELLKTYIFPGTLLPVLTAATS